MLQDKRILVVEDDAHVVEVIRATLELEGAVVSVAEDGEAGLQQALNERHDLLLLDLMLPKRGGLEVCRELRNQKRILPIIMLTAKADEVDKVLGLELGADDYVTKPFSPRELVARCKAALRRFDRAESVPTGSELTFGQLRVYPEQYRAEYKGKDMELTPKEFEVFSLMAAHPGQTFTRDQLLDRVWGFEALSETRTVDEHVKRIRRKLREHHCEAVAIKTIWGVGYRLEVRT